MAKATREKKRETEIEDYVGSVDRTSLGWERSRDSRGGFGLALYGRMLLPRSMEGLRFEASLLGKTDDELSSMGMLEMRGRGREGPVDIIVYMPRDDFPALSAAFHDGRLSLCHVRGSPLFHRKSKLIDISFEDRVSFESHWGERLPSG